MDSKYKNAYVFALYNAIHLEKYFLNPLDIFKIIYSESENVALIDFEFHENIIHVKPYGVILVLYNSEIYIVDLKQLVCNKDLSQRENMNFIYNTGDVPNLEKLASCGSILTYNLFWPSVSHGYNFVINEIIECFMIPSISQKFEMCIRDNCKLSENEYNILFSKYWNIECLKKFLDRDILEKVIMNLQPLIIAIIRIVHKEKLDIKNERRILQDRLSWLSKEEANKSLCCNFYDNCHLNMK